MKQILLSLFALLATGTFTYAQTCTPQGDPTVYGSNNTWNGYVYNTTGLTGYVGYVNEGTTASPNFDQNFGGDNVTYTTNGCSVQTERFSVRYRLTKTLAAYNYRFIVGADDGYRLSLDGGATWVIDRWVGQSYNTTTYNAFLAAGNYNIVLEYYENTGSNRISFNMTQICMGTEDQSVYGTGNTWRGYVYEGINFNTYKGVVTEGTATNMAFDENFGGDNVTYNTSACGITTEVFSVRYRLRKTFTAGTYTFVLGADDGYRFSLDGGATWSINNWTLHSYTSSSFNTTLAAGTYDLVLEYYEQNGQNRVNFNMLQNAVLPIELVSFTGKQRNGALDLSWKISDDSNPAYFEVEKSADGMSFGKIGTVKANSNVSYTYTDAAVTTGNSFYRMKMTDLTGVVTYSNVLSFRTNATVSQGINIYPSIVSGTTLSMESAVAMEQAKVIISDAAGRPVSQKVIGKVSKGQVSTIETSSYKLPAGMYFLQVVNGNENIGVKRFVVK
ncbi:MAG: T9SS type A sorting domain-containing protein [Chitinophagaceae bacterium]|nr:MAG: T9SS type A sorting domain-containing protein [Chitinophagaceae bacterium]